MARPRVFISSTFYDLKQVRSDLEFFIKELGYEPVLNERGTIPYGPEEKLEEYCYKEIERADVLVSIVGGRYGSGSQHAPYSISQMELKTALKLNRQVYIFVEQAVLSEFSTYQNNKEVEGVKYRFVDDTRIYNFLEEVYSLPLNNAIAPFEVSQHITAYLREQWAGTFQRLLQEQGQKKMFQMADKLQSTAQTLNQLVDFLTAERRNKDEAIRNILLANHPAFHRLRSIFRLEYPLYFTNFQEVSAWLSGRGYFEDVEAEGPEHVFISGRDKIELRLYGGLFDMDGIINVFSEHEWNERWIVRKSIIDDETDPFADLDDETDPFADV